MSEIQARKSLSMVVLISLGMMLAWELKLLNVTVSVIMYKIKGF